jgi:hypothetical protein
MQKRTFFTALLILLVSLGFTSTVNADSRYAKVNGRLVLILEPEEKPQWVKTVNGCTQKKPPCFYAYRGTFKVPKSHPDESIRNQLYKFSFWVGLENNGKIKINFSTALPGAVISTANVEQSKSEVEKLGLSLRTDHFLFNKISSSTRCAPFTNTEAWKHGGIQCHFGGKALAAYSVLGDPRIRRAMRTKSGNFGGVLLEVTNHFSVKGKATDLLFSIPISDRRFQQSDFEFTGRTIDRLSENKKYFASVGKVAGLYEIKSPQTGRCLTLEDRTVGGVLSPPDIVAATPFNSRSETVVQDVCGAGDPDVVRYASKWYYVDCANVGCKSGRVVNAFTGQCLSYRNGALTPGIPLKLVPCKLFGETKRMDFSPLVISSGDVSVGFLTSQVNYERGCLTFVGKGLAVQMTQCNSNALEDMRLDQTIDFAEKFSM